MPRGPIHPLNLIGASNSKASRKSASDIIAYNDLKAEILRLKKQNLSNKAIADLVGMSPITIGKLLPRILREALQDAGAAEVRVMEMMRLEEITQRMWKRLDDPEWIPDDKWLHGYLALSQRKANYVGADAPKKVDVDLAISGLPSDTASPSEALAMNVERFMDLADRIKAAGIGSGRAEPEPKELLPAKNADGTDRALDPDDEVVDAEIVSPFEKPVPKAEFYEDGGGDEDSEHDASRIDFPEEGYDE